MPYREVEHTADLALLVEAPTLSELFGEACRGMAWLQYGDAPQSPEKVWRSVRIAAQDYEMLLVEWLNELLYLGEREQLRVLDVRIDMLTEYVIKSSFCTCAASPLVHSIKAVTYSDLAIQQIDSMLRVLLTFDV